MLVPTLTKDNIRQFFIERGPTPVLISQLETHFRTDKNGKRTRLREILGKLAGSKMIESVEVQSLPMMTFGETLTRLMNLPLTETAFRLRVDYDYVERRNDPGTGTTDCPGSPG
jgi:hypothetical protein